jgi:hypothetical protein
LWDGHRRRLVVPIALSQNPMRDGAVATMVWFSAASSMPSMIATKIRLRRCGLISARLRGDPRLG